MFKSKLKYLAYALIVGLFLLSFLPLQLVTLSGDTMGTTYTIKYLTRFPFFKSFIHTQIQATLSDLSDIFSTYSSTSEISKINKSTEFNPMLISTHLYHVIDFALSVSKQTNGFYDITTGPLHELWGFKKLDNNHPKIPSHDDILSVLPYIGYSLVNLSPPYSLSKYHAKTQLDLSSVAKGYAVDQVANKLSQFRIERMMIEIGGEVFALGLSNRNRPWQLGIDTSSLIVLLSNKALATSGTYRQYFDDQNNRYSHIINPHTGYPVSNSVISVSVIADTCMVADAWATALMFYKPKKAIEIVNQIPNLECLIKTSSREFMSKRFNEYCVSYN